MPSTSKNLVQSQTELIKNAPYQPDPTAVPYPNLAEPARYDIEITVEYWTAPGGPFTSTVRNDGLQRITVTVDHDGVEMHRTQSYKVQR